MTRINLLQRSLAALFIGAASIAAALAADALPVAWASMDIGKPTSPGAASEKDGAFTVYGNGGGITAAGDTFHFVFQPASQDCSFTARVSKLTAAGDGAFAGVMIRDALSPTSNFAAVVDTPTQGASFTYRNATVPGLTSQNGPATSGALWVKVVRRGVTVDGYAAPDVNNAPGAWQQIGGDQPIGSGMIFVGLCASCNQPGSCAAAIDNVAFTEGTVPGLESGTYHIIPISAPAMALDAHADAAEGAPVHLAAFGSAPSQLWAVTFKGDGAYTIQPSDHAGLSLSTDSKHLTNGSKVFLSSTQPPENNLWTVAPLADGVYGLQLHSTPSFGLDDYGGGSTPDATIDAYGFNGGDQHEQWALVPMGKAYQPPASAAGAGLDDGTYGLSPIRGPDMSLAAVAQGATAIAALAKQAGDDNQKWVFTNKGDNWYRIQPVSGPTLSLTVISTASANGTKLIVTTDQGLPTQLWRVESAGNGAIWLTPKSAPSTAIDDPGGSVAVGTTTQIWEMDRGNLNLQWLIHSPG